MPTGQFYFGFRCRNQALNIPPQSDLWISYFSSSKHVKNLISKHGKENFSFEILFEHQDKEVCFQYEQKLISEHFSNKLILNKAHHKNNTRMFIGQKGMKRSKESIAKSAAGLRGRKRPQSIRDKISKSKKGKPPLNKGKSPPNVCCVVCRKIFSVANFIRWHKDCVKSQDMKIEEFIMSVNLPISRKDILQKLNVPENSFDAQFQKIKKRNNKIKSRKYKVNGTMTSEYWYECN